MAATAQNQKDEKLLRFPKPVKGIRKSDRKKRLPELTSTDIEDFFSNADSKGKIKRFAA
ncbi:MAG: hypothetical protein VX874_00760 [Pseudomonadota bacterium]|nr:hypothetical protein [Pseudomonadota bacterium]